VISPPLIALKRWVSLSLRQLRRTPFFKAPRTPEPGTTSDLPNVLRLLKFLGQIQQLAVHRGGSLGPASISLSPCGSTQISPIERPGFAARESLRVLDGRPLKPLDYSHKAVGRRLPSLFILKIRLPRRGRPLRNCQTPLILL